MHIVDNTGKMIEVTDLAAAIEQAAIFQTYRHTDPEFEKLDDRLQLYWTDLHNKLINLKK